ncbi:MAG: DUF4271 domain-containing protein [Bacteroidales bacterium]|nr:DUF4271 domain-containing protein [Bacteroidales bacterium]MDD2263349.1 DUF4271 domain-containing protein [Bacteroidales bacterium]MDD2830861.1 DUF4271 domain-containing protein [Bacteroidales bacterium]MDD3208060.1 DUF4271 domain-containing protein [Bacteroidales bacterium]MDD3696433.1 DUF4271 domain-containing protein [Bacteroidales bacterium]
MDYIVLGLIVSFCFILIFTRAPLTRLLTGCFRYNISIENEDQGNIRFSRFFLCFFILAVISFFIASHDRLLSPRPFALTGMSKPFVFMAVLGTFCIWVLFKMILLRIIGWTIDSSAFMNFLGRTGQDYCILTGLAFIPFLVLFHILGKPSGNTILLAAAVLSAAGYLIYALRCIRIFLSAGYSLFFWILYLCTFELVPFGVLIHYLAGI